jgi:hypothetical protein
MRRICPTVALAAFGAGVKPLRDGLLCPSARTFAVVVACAVAWVHTNGCTAARPHDRATIQSQNPSERILAIRTAAETKDQGAVPLLVDRLEDEDEAVRFFAIIALDKITGERFGYDYAQPANLRAKAVERWREYVRQGRDIHMSDHDERLGYPGRASRIPISPVGETGS